MTTSVARYQRIARLYDPLDLPIERRRYRAVRPLLFRGMAGRPRDAGVGTGRNCEFYQPDAIVSAIDTSPAMLKRAHDRCPTLAAAGRLHRMDVTAMEFPAGSFDAAVASFLFCVLPDELQVPALREFGRVVKPGGLIRLLDMSARPASRAGWSRASGSLGSPGLWCELRSANRAAHSRGWAGSCRNPLCRRRPAEAAHRACVFCSSAVIDRRAANPVISGT